MMLFILALLLTLLLSSSCSTIWLMALSLEVHNFSGPVIGALFILLWLGGGLVDEDETACCIVAVDKVEFVSV